MGERLNGKLITDYKKRTNTPTEVIAVSLGVSVSMARQMERGYIPREDREVILDRLALLLGVSVDALVSPVKVA